MPRKKSQSATADPTFAENTNKLPPKKYDYGTVSKPVEGIEPGAVLPFSEFPSNNACPWCDKGPYKNSNGLRGHAHGVHGVRWESNPANKPRNQTLAELKKSLPQTKDLERLRPAHILGITQHELFNYSWEEVAKRVGYSAHTLAEAAKSPAGQRLKETLQGFLDDPAVLVQMVLRAHAVDATADYVMALEWAKEARDYAFVAKVSKEIWEMTDIVNKDKSSEPQKTELHIHLDSGSLAEAPVLSDFKTIEVNDPEFE